MIDIHTHILPFIDDGAKDMEESIKIAKNLYEQGIKKVIATPHYIKSDSPPSKNKVNNLIKKLQNELNKENINLEILPGSEIFLTMDIGNDLQENKIHTLNKTKYILIEFPMNYLPQNLEDSIYNLQVLGYQPIIAHPERYFYVINDYSLVKKWIDLGAYIQINAGSLLGVYGKKIEKTSIKIIENRLAQLIASDTHCQKLKRGKLISGLNKLEKLTNSKEKNIFIENSRKLIANQKIAIINSPKKRVSFFGNLKNIFLNNFLFL